MSFRFEEQTLFEGKSIMQTQRQFLFFCSVFMKCPKKPYYLTSRKNLRQKELQYFEFQMEKLRKAKIIIPP